LHGNDESSYDEMSCTGTAPNYHCTKTFTLATNNDDFYNKALALTVRVQTMTEGYSEWYDMYNRFPTENCNDGYDNDEDGKTDCGDSECYYIPPGFGSPKSSVCGKKPNVDVNTRNSAYTYDTYCSQGNNPLNPNNYGRCCPSGQYWNGEECEDADACSSSCYQTPFTQDWWSNSNCFVYSGGKITYSCHPTDFFGDGEYYEFEVRII